jgi:hypothetical protein
MTDPGHAVTGLPAAGQLRPGGSWSAKGGLTTLVAEGDGPADEQGRRPGDVNVGTVLSPGLAAEICEAVNERRAARAGCADELRAHATAETAGWLPQLADRWDGGQRRPACPKD